MANVGNNLVEYQGKLEQAKQTGLDLNRGFGKNLVKYQGKLKQAKQTALDLNRGWAKLEQKLGQFVVFQDSLETLSVCR